MLLYTAGAGAGGEADDQDGGSRAGTVHLSIIASHLGSSAYNPRQDG